MEHINTQSPLFYYSYINLPIKFGYKLKQFKHFSIAMETGIIFSKLVESKIPEASFYMPESTLIKIDDNTPVRRDFNYQVVVGLKFNYKLFKSVSISAEPEFTKYLNSIYKSSPDISSTKPYSMGLRFGIYYDF
ncbi:MAG: hypothetical protein C0598_00920 [Marinilabiliales bacterium]|nr:MAG: hypothetical protein C0598_00920 [Marinilabiliales bacterium]